MSRRAVRVTRDARVDRFDYAGAPAGTPVVMPPTRARSAQVVAPGSAPPPAPSLGLSHPPAAAAGHGLPVMDDAGASHQDAFNRGYAQGERAGLDLAARQLQAVHERLGHSLEQLAGLREELIYRTERQVVELALAVAARILHREVTLDRELLLVMARIALDRIGDATGATIRLHPDDEAAARGGRETWSGSGVAIVADPSVRPGACVVQTAHGQAEVGVDAQVRELATALLGDTPGVGQGAVR